MAGQTLNGGQTDVDHEPAGSGESGKAAGAAAGLQLRCTPRSGDIEVVRKLAASAAVFNLIEQAVAVELLEDRLRAGSDSGYFFIFAEQAGRVVGYAAWGPVPLTVQSYDLYWIVVDPELQGSGVGRTLLEAVERQVVENGGGQLYIETSSRPPYRRTRRFYQRAAYRRAARFENFYAPGDHKVVFCKTLLPRLP